MKLSVIIVNYNVKYFLEQCLLSLRKALANIPSEIIVVDNASSDGSREYVKDRFPGIIFIWNKENLGFSKANNLALKQAKGTYILFLNPDTLVAENSLSYCLDFFSKQKDCGALGVRMISGDGSFLKESKRYTDYKADPISLVPQDSIEKFYVPYYFSNDTTKYSGENPGETIIAMTKTWAIRPQLFLKSEEQFRYLVREPSFAEFEFLGHAFGLATSRHW